MRKTNGDWRSYISNRNEHLQCTCAKEPKNLKQCCSPMVHLPGAVFVDAFSATTFWGWIDSAIAALSSVGKTPIQNYPRFRNSDPETSAITVKCSLMERITMVIIMMMTRMTIVIIIVIAIIPAGPKPNFVWSFTKDHSFTKRPNFPVLPSGTGGSRMVG